MADGADSTDASHQARHLVKGPAFAKFFETANLRDVKVRVVDETMLIELDRDLGVSFDARNRVNDNVLGHGHTSSCAKARQVSYIRRSSRQQFGDDMVNDPCRRRTPRHREVDRNDLMERTNAR